MTNNNLYLSSYQIPRTDQQLIKFSNSNSNPSSTLDNTPTMMIPFGVTVNGSRDNCTTENIAFNTGLLCTFLPTEPANGNSIKCKITSQIGNNYNGWLKRINGAFNQNVDFAYWQQGLTQYNGIGASYNDADIFTITMISPFNNIPVDGYPDSLGSMTIKIDNLSSINSSTNEIITYFDMMKIIVFKYQSSIYNQRANQGSNSCNLFVTTNCK